MTFANGTTFQASNESNDWQTIRHASADGSKQRKTGGTVSSEIQNDPYSHERGMQMTPATTTYEHVEIDPNGVPLIAGTTMKMVELVMAQLAYGWSPEDLFFSIPT